MRVGRNDPCPCGSGKKFKRCCGATEEGSRLFREDAPRGEPVVGWARAHAIWPKTREALIEHGRRWLGEDAFADAIDDFPFDTDEEVVEGEPPQWAELFLSWQLYDWIPDGEEMTVADHWLKMAGTVASAVDDVHRMIRSANAHPLSFYQVQAVDRGRGAVLNNLLADEELFVVDRSLSESVPPWTILFGRLVEFGGISIFDAVGYQPLSPDMVDEVVAQSADVLDTDPPAPMPVLRNAGTDLVDIYDDALFELYERGTRRPVLHTTDGELLVPCKDTWSIEDGKRDEVLARLGDLGFEADTQREVISFRWVRENAPSDPLPTVHLGTVTVESDKVIVETRSRERQARLTEQVAQALGALVQHVASEERDQSEIFDQVAAQGEADDGVDSTESIAPELQNQLVREYLERHYATWPDTEIPALGGKTPRAAVKNQGGRTKVEALIRDMEFRTHGSPMEGAYDFDALRRELGLPTAR